MLDDHYGSLRYWEKRLERIQSQLLECERGFLDRRTPRLLTQGEEACKEIALLKHQIAETKDKYKKRTQQKLF